MVNRTKRNFLKTIGSGSIIGIAGCLGNGDSQESDNNSGSSQTLEVVHWLTAGVEKVAINSLFDGYKSEYPEYTVKPSSVPGAGGVSMNSELGTRLVNDDPPGTFMSQAGKKNLPYTEADVVEPIGDSVWNDAMREAIPNRVQELCKIDGDYICVPLTLTKRNNLFYNSSVVKEAGVNPDDLNSPSALLNALATIDAETDATPLAHESKSGWATIGGLWEPIFVSQNSADAAREVYKGNGNQYKKEIQDVFELITEYREYFPPDAGSISWSEAANRVLAGDAAFLSMGDWAAPVYLLQEDFEYGNDWDYTPFPGTEDTFIMVNDTFTYPKNNPSPDAAEAFLSYCGSLDGQESFCVPKAALPSRTDISEDVLTPYLQSQKEYYNNTDNIMLTVAGGGAVRPSVTSKVYEATAAFLENWDPEQATNDLINATSN